jgi:hypothetical protein
MAVEPRIPTIRTGVLWWIDRLPTPLLGELAPYLFTDGGLFGDWAHAYIRESNTVHFDFISSEYDSHWWHWDDLHYYHSIVRWFQWKCRVPEHFTLRIDAYCKLGNDWYGTVRHLDTIFEARDGFTPDEVTIYLASPTEWSDWLVWSYYVAYCDMFSNDVRVDDTDEATYTSDRIFSPWLYRPPVPPGAVPEQEEEAPMQEEEQVPVGVEEGEVLAAPAADAAL